MLQFFFPAADNIGFTEWAQWSICEAKCGFDEMTTRQRECIGKCKSNKTVDKRNCGLPPCPGKLLLSLLNWSSTALTMESLYSEAAIKDAL